MPLHPYQQEAHDAVMSWVSKSAEPCLIEAPTGAGKSHIIAEIAKSMHHVSKGKHVLCLVPSKELLEQNAEKYRLTGNKCSLFSASVDSKCLRHPVVFGTPLTVKNKAYKFGEKFCAVILDEAHKALTPTILSIINTIKKANPYLRVIGLTATPYKLGHGYIYLLDENDKAHGENRAKNPHFKKKVYGIDARYLIDNGYLTQPTIGKINSGHYETKEMSVNKLGNFDKADIDRAYHGHGRLTSAIINDVVSQSQNRQGVLIYAATIQHAKEVLASLPPKLSSIVTGDTDKSERARILKRLREKRLKYVVNVAVLTTGVDVPHIDVIAILRATESVSLLQQIIGRGLRTAPDKKDCLVLDYAENLERHCPDGDIFKPNIKASLIESGSSPLVCTCPECGGENEFSRVKNEAKLEIDENGYFLDLTGKRVMTEYGPMPAHFGRRCTQYKKIYGKYERCNYRWTFKACKECEHENDIAARYCAGCKAELVDPNEKLIGDFKAMKKDPYRLQTDKIIEIQESITISQKGNECLKVTFTTEYRTFTVWLVKNSSKYNLFVDYKDIQTVTYKKNRVTEFFDIYAYNQKADEI